MSKSILVIDTPETCLDCRFCRELHEGIEACCELFEEPNDKEFFKMIEADYCQEKPDWCPLRNLPERKDMEPGKTIIRAAQHEGWNMCIDEILKGGDEK